MTRIPHRTALLWLMYATCMVFVWALIVYHGLLQRVLAHDHSYMTLPLLIMYAVAELSNAFWALKIDKIIETREFEAFFDDYYGNSGQYVGFGDWISGRMLIFGLFSTMVGIIVAFWPFIAAGADVESLKNHVGEFFSGVAIAFIPATVSFAAKFALDFSSKIVGLAVQYAKEATYEE